MNLHFFSPKICSAGPTKHAVTNKPKGKAKAGDQLKWSNKIFFFGSKKLVSIKQSFK